MSAQRTGFSLLHNGWKATSPKSATAILDAAITAAELEKRLTAHKLRHTFASLLLNPGVPVIKVSRLLGHRDATITLKVYAHFIKDKSDHVQELASSILS